MVIIGDLLDYFVLSLLSTGQPRTQYWVRGSTHEDRKRPDITEKLLTGT